MIYFCLFILDNRTFYGSSQMNFVDDIAMPRVQRLDEPAGEPEGQKLIWNFHCFLWRGLFYFLPIGELERLQVAIWPPASAFAREETESQERD